MLFFSIFAVTYRQFFEKVASRYKTRDKFHKLKKALIKEHLWERESPDSPYIKQCLEEEQHVRFASATLMETCAVLSFAEMLKENLDQASKTVGSFLKGKSKNKLGIFAWFCYYNVQQSVTRLILELKGFWN